MAIVWAVRIFLAAFILFLGSGLPMLGRDIVAVAKGEAPLMRTGLVVYKSGASFTGFFVQTIVVDEAHSTHENSFSAPYFPPRYFEIGKTYSILYISNTHNILDAQLK